MMPEWNSLTTVVSMVGTIALAIWVGRGQNRVNKTQAEDTRMSTEAKWRDELEERITKLEVALTASQNENHLLLQWASTLVEHLVKVGEKPLTFEQFKRQNGRRR